jgi:hypothetical protein
LSARRTFDLGLAARRPAIHYLWPFITTAETLMESRVDYVGNERAPVLVIDNLWPDATALLELAAQRDDYGESSLYYPGVRSAAPREYAAAIVASLGDLMRQTFSISDELEITDSIFSLVTTPPEKLVPFQRVPHFDSVDHNRFALLHYLCASGGTSFYRHRTSGIETVTPETQETYIRAVNAEVRSTGMPPAQYVEGDTGLFERTAKYEAAFNRALIYRGSMLHSVNVPPAFVPDANPRTGRLTVNTFLIARPPAN